MDSESITIHAFAKINWSLYVPGKREDGYHEIDTVLQTVSLHDTITFEETSDDVIRLWCDDRLVPADKTNLVWQAAAASARTLFDQTGRQDSSGKTHSGRSWSRGWIF